jgi:5-methylcytosine-specific restriction enzyme A
MPQRPKTHRPAGYPKRAPDLRASAAKRGYDRRWRAYRLAFLASHPLCLMCEVEDGLYVAATEVDHVQAVSGPEDPKFWDASNHRPLCKRHHSLKTAQEDGGFGR